jgi:hypothetical protein
LPYKLVTKQLINRKPNPGLSLPDRLKEIFQGLFPTRPMVDLIVQYKSDNIEEVTTNELVEIAKTLSLDKVPISDGVPNMVVKAVML